MPRERTHTDADLIRAGWSQPPAFHDADLRRALHAPGLEIGAYRRLSRLAERVARWAERQALAAENRRAARA